MARRSLAQPARSARRPCCHDRRCFRCRLRTPAPSPAPAQRSAGQGAARLVRRKFSPHSARAERRRSASITGPRAPYRLSSTTVPLPARRAIAATLKADLARADAIDTSRLSLRDPHQRRSREERLPDRARGLRIALWRRRRRQLAQHAIRRDPERRRLYRHAAIPRHRPSDRESRRCRGLSRAASRNIRASSTASSGGCARRAPRASSRPTS